MVFRNNPATPRNQNAVQNSFFTARIGGQNPESRDRGSAALDPGPSTLSVAANIGRQNRENRDKGTTALDARLSTLYSVGMGKLTHFADGQPRMVDVSEKTATLRTATAEAEVLLQPEAVQALQEGGVGKGDPLSVAQLAGIMAAKKTGELIPLCHPLPIAAAEVELRFAPEEARVYIRATVKTKAETGVEMEALTACAVAALTVYDMLKAASKGLEITGLRLLYKSGGKSGEWRREK